MSKELVISANRHETRVAMLEDDQVVEVYHQRENEYSLAGSIHKGRVTRVLPGMQSAFVDIGLDRDAFLYVSDFFEDNDEYDKIVTSVEEKVLKLDRAPRCAGAGVARRGGAGAGAAPRWTAPRARGRSPAAPPRRRRAPCRSAPVPADRRRAAVATRGDAVARDRSRGDQGGGDRRGRTPRRGRGQRSGGSGGGRGLPESKYYSPRPERRTASPAGSRPPESPRRRRRGTGAATARRLRPPSRTISSCCPANRWPSTPRHAERRAQAGAVRRRATPIADGRRTRRR